MIRSACKTMTVLMLLAFGTGAAAQLYDGARLMLMHAAGMTAMEVIVAATSRAAEYLQLPDRGTLMAGNRADFLVLDANPLDDIRNTRRIARMFVNGVEVDRAALKGSWIR